MLKLISSHLSSFGSTFTSYLELIESKISSYIPSFKAPAAVQGKEKVKDTTAYIRDFVMASTESEKQAALSLIPDFYPYNKD